MSWTTGKSRSGQSMMIPKAVVASFGGTALGDIALVPAIGMKNPKGIRGVEEWYMSTLIREDFVKEIL